MRSASPLITTRGHCHPPSLALPLTNCIIHYVYNTLQYFTVIITMILLMIVIIIIHITVDSMTINYSTLFAFHCGSFYSVLLSNSLICP